MSFGGKSNFKPSKVHDVPPKQPFVMRSVKLLESRALRSLSRYGFLMLLRFEVEHCRHAGKENGYLIVTYKQFVEWGIPRKFIKPTITELVNAKLLVVEHKGRSLGGDGNPSLYRLTYLKSKIVPITGSPYFVEPSGEWENSKLPHPNRQNPAKASAALSTSVGNRAKFIFSVPPQGTEPVPPLGTVRDDQIAEIRQPAQYPRRELLSTLRSIREAARGKRWTGRSRPAPMG